MDNVNLQQEDNNSVSKKGQTFLILSPHRSGTSILSIILQNLGASEPKTVMKPTQDNPKGYGESSALMKVHDKLLGNLGSDWADWSMPSHLELPEVTISYEINLLKKAFKAEFEDAPLVVLKDPRVCRFADLWIRCLESMDNEPLPIITVRNPMEVAKSLQRRDGFPIEQGLLLWLVLILSSEHFCKSRRRVYVSYSGVLEDWRNVVSTISNAFDVKWPAFNEKKSIEIDRLVTRDLHRNKFDDESFYARVDVPSIVKNVYRRMMDICLSGGIPSDKDKEYFEEVYTQLANISPIFNSLVRRLEDNHKSREIEVSEEKLLEKERELEALDERFQIELSALNSQFDDELSTLKTAHLEKVEQSEKLLAELVLSNTSLREEVASKKTEISQLETDLVSERQSHTRNVSETKHTFEHKIGILDRAKTEAAKKHKLEIQTEQQHKLRILSDCTEQAEKLNQVKWKLRTAEEDNYALKQREALVSLSKKQYGKKELVIAHKVARQLFDKAFYLSQATKNGVKVRITPLTHYLTKGAALGLNPHPFFDTKWYSLQNKDVADAGENPLLHFLNHGVQENRNPHPLIDIQWIQDHLPEGKISGENPILQFLKLNGKCSPHPLFDPVWYLKEYSDVAQSGINPLMHYIVNGGEEGRQPHPLFDGKWYKKRCLTSRSSQLEPLTHYVLFGHKYQVSPHPLFDSEWYANQCANDTLENEIPLVDYIVRGELMGREPNALFRPDWARQQVGVDVQLPNKSLLCHYIQVDSKTEFQPHPLVDVDWYRSTHKRAAKSTFKSLVHFFQTAPAKRTSTNPEFNADWYRKTYLAAHPNMCPTHHYIKIGSKTGFKPNPSFVTDSGFESDDDNITALENFIHNSSDTSRLSKKALISKKLDDRAAILFVAHVAGERLYGGERSFLDVLSQVDRKKYRVIVALPDPHPHYEAIVAQHADDVVHFPQIWWQNHNMPRQDVIEKFQSIIQEQDIDLVYANTIILRECMHAARNVGVPNICHVRELIDLDPDLTRFIGLKSKEIMAQVGERSDRFIANSKLTASMLEKTGKDVSTLYNAVDVDALNIPTIADQRECLTVGMLSSNIPKKGIEDLYVLAKQAKFRELPVRFKVFGPRTQEVRALQAAAEQDGYDDIVELAGYVENSKDGIEQLDVVLNFSHFAESFGRTIAEAMAARRPVIVYNYGALPELVDHERTGFVIPYKKPLNAIEYLERLSSDRALLKEMGARARKVASAKFSLEILKKDLNAFLGELLPDRKSMPPINLHGAPKISVVIPNYNYEDFLPERIESIVNQTYAPAEIIFLDDVSTDESVKVAEEILSQSSIPYRIVPNQENQGVYRQWLKGFELAKHDWVWVAEADDSCEPDFLETLVERVDDDINIVFSQSKRIDEHGNTTRSNNRQHTDEIDPEFWKKNYTVSGSREVVDRLAYRNTIPNVSATIIRKDSLIGAAELLKQFKYAGDWMLYAYILRTGKIAFESRSLNHFRRHSGSVTRIASKSEEYIRELALVRQFLIDNFPVLPSQIGRMNAFLDKDYKVEDVAQNSQYESVLPQLIEIEEQVQTRRRYAFITTNNGSFYGGSEILWREAALELAKAKNDVIVLIKKWDPVPEFLKEMEIAGITVLFKEDEGFEGILSLQPDLTTVSIGDQDEGLEYYSRLTEKGCDYIIVNQLTKEERVWPIRKNKNDAVGRAYLDAKTVYFTSKNNIRVMESRLGHSLPNADQHFNPYHIDRQIVPDWPSLENGFQIAIPSKLLFIHKGQDLLLEVCKQKKWRERDVVFNLYGIGPDEDNIRKIIKANELTNVKLCGRVSDISEIWKSNHALLMPSRMEGLPIMLVSAMLSERVSILTDVGGHAEVVFDNELGFIAKDPEISDLEDAMERAWQARNEWNAMGMKARERILDYLPEDPVADFLRRIRRLI